MGMVGVGVGVDGFEVAGSGVMEVKVLVLVALDAGREWVRVVWSDMERWWRVQQRFVKPSWVADVDRTVLLLTCRILSRGEGWSRGLLDGVLEDDGSSSILTR